MGQFNERRVVITGMGAITPLGTSVPESWKEIITGKTNVRKITHFDVEGCRTQIASYIDEYEDLLKERLTREQLKDIRIADRFAHFSVIATQEALKDAKLLDSDNLLKQPYRDRTGVGIGTGIGAPRKVTEMALALNEKSQWQKEDKEEFLTKLTRMSRKYAASSVTMLPDSGSFVPSIVFRIKGISICDIAACSTGVMNLALASTLIKEGRQDIIIAGGADATIDFVSHWAFSFIKATTARNNDPMHASRPFDKERDGFVMAEGGAVLVLEELEHAITRGARIYAEIIGWGAALDGAGFTEPEGEHSEDWGQVRAMRMALKDAGISPEEVDYINAHGTSTPAGDINETKSIQLVYGKSARNIPVSSTKSETGHLLGAAGALETIVCVKSIEEGIIPPTINYEFPDPECDLDYTPNTPRKRKVRIAVNNSFGMGGQNAVIVVKEFST